MSSGGVSYRVVGGAGGNNTVNNVTNIIVRFLLLVKSGLPNFVSFPFVFVL